jgi:hypothetical protein
MPNGLLATLFLVWWFLIGFFLKTNTKCSSECPYRLWRFLIQFSSKTDASCSSGYPPLVVVSYSILIENWCQNDLLATLLLWWFLIQFLLKTDANMLFLLCSSSCGGFLFNSHWKLIPNALLATLLLLWWFLIQFSFKTEA